MKTNFLQTTALVLFISALLFTSQNVYSQPAPDENFCAVQAKLLEGDSICFVSGNAPYYYNFDDGDAEDYAMWVEVGGISVVKFASPGYPVQLTAGQIYVGDGSFPVGADFLGTDFLVVVFDDDGPDNFPGTMLESLIVTVENYGWITFNGIDAVIEDGDFYLGMKQLGTPPNAAPLGIDTDLPAKHNSYIKQAGGEWILSPYQDLMIRSLRCWADYQERELVQQDSIWYEIARISDFNPNNGEGPEDGSLTIVDSTHLFFFSAYKDTLFYSLPPGYYAYAVRKNTNDSTHTGWYYTNVVNNFATAIANHNDLNEIKVFPNPVVDQLNIKSDKMIQSVSILNLLGQTVFNESFDTQEISIRTGFLESGFYFVRVKTAQGWIFKKILIAER